MSHMVIYRGSDGKPGYHQVDDIHDAVSFVEEMRNKEGVDHARIFRLEEVTFQFKPYYRVEIGNGATTEIGESQDEPASVVEIESADDEESTEVDESANGQTDEEMADDDGDEVVDDDPESEDAPGGARRGLFGR